MRTASRCAAVALVAALGPLAPGSIAQTSETPSTTRTTRGGVLNRTENYRFEAFFYTTGVRLLVADRSDQLISPADLSGTATFYHPNSPNPWFTRSLDPGSGSLDLVLGMANVPR